MLRRYLFEFLNDPRVIDINATKDFFLLILSLFRSVHQNLPRFIRVVGGESLPAGRQGSPIIIYGESVKRKTSERIGRGI